MFIVNIIYYIIVDIFRSLDRLLHRIDQERDQRVGRLAGTHSPSSGGGNPAISPVEATQAGSPCDPMQQVALSLPRHAQKIRRLAENAPGIFI
jgi:hypothetical protein